MAVSSIIVEENDQPDIPPVDHESHVRLRITDTVNILFNNLLFDFNYVFLSFHKFNIYYID